VMGPSSAGQVPGVKVDPDRSRASATASESTGTAYPHEPSIIGLQRTLGNWAVTRMLGSLAVQAKRTVGAPDNAYEKEADAVAEQVMSTPIPAVAAPGDSDEDPRTAPNAGGAGDQHLTRQLMRGPIPIAGLRRAIGMRALARILQQSPLQSSVRHVCRKCGCAAESEGECAACQAKRLAQRNPVGTDAGMEAPAIVEDVLGTPGQPLAESARKNLEPRFGQDFRQVRIHEDSRAAESASAVNALAYTVGNHIVFGAAQYAPGTPAGDRLLAHELTHTIQQTGGTPMNVHRLSWDDVTEAVSQTGTAVEQGAEAVGVAVTSGVEAAGEAVASGAQAVAEGAQAIGQEGARRYPISARHCPGVPQERVRRLPETRRLPGGRRPPPPVGLRLLDGSSKTTPPISRPGR